MLNGCARIGAPDGFEGARHTVIVEGLEPLIAALAA